MLPVSGLVDIDFQRYGPVNVSFLFRLAAECCYSNSLILFLSLTLHSIYSLSAVYFLSINIPIRRQEYSELFSLFAFPHILWMKGKYCDRVEE